jgi:5-methylcytosine-specific restriction endonuclease McrA
MHQVYLETEGWLRLRRKVMKRCAGLCEACGRVPAVEVHHLTYEHWRKERLSELQGLCRKCHRAKHGKRN